jgi:anti-sigma-K factor RskA
MTEPMRPPLTCDQADELAGAWGLGALDPEEADAVASHLASCDRPHEELRAAPGAGSVLDVALEPIAPSPGLRGRVMDSIGAMPRATHPPPEPAPMPWYRRGWVPRVAALAAAAAIVGLAVWNVQLRGELGDREAELRQVASALSRGGTAVAVSGPAGNGLLVAGEEGPILVAGVPVPEPGHLYEMWLIDDEGTPVAVGTFTPGADDELVIARLEQSTEGFATFAVTVEQERVDAPTSDPVLVAPLS